MKKIALVGCGRISERHIEAIRDTEGVELGLICDNIPEKGKKLSEKLGVGFEQNYKNIQGVDIISVLTPSGLHPRHVIEISENCDAKYIVCEKPISLTLREAYEIFTVVKSNGKILLPVYQNRYNPLIKLLKHIISSGELGRIYQFVCNIFWNRKDDYYKNSWHGTKELDGGVLYTQASHYIDMIHFLFGETVQTKGIGGNQRKLEVYDTVSAICEFKNGVIGSLNATVSTFRENYLTEFIVIAEKGTMRLSGTNLNTISYWDIEGIEKPDIDFTLDHIYGKGHNIMYGYISQDQFDQFPSEQDVLAGIRLMELLSY